MSDKMCSETPRIERSACIFCNIANKLENTEILFEDEDVCVFRDIKPASDYHILTIPKRHIEDAKCLTAADKDLVEKMLTTAKELLTKNNLSVEDARFGYHWPPFRSVRHLHLHTIAPESKMSLMGRMVFMKNSYWFASPEAGVFFPHGRDIDSCLLFIMKAKLYIKNQKNLEEVKKVVIYWLERIEREEEGKKITIFFDMDGCGLNNMDIEVIMFMVTLLKSYYPNMVNYIIVFQLPWMLTAGFKIVKGILPAAAVERLRMVNKDKLKDLVAPEQALVSWGGKDNYVFEFFPENRVNIDKQCKNVSFSEDCHTKEMLLLNPSKLLIFRNHNEKFSTQLTVTNMEECCVAFKIRTTAPEKYVVRPSSGNLTSKASQIINISVNSDFLISSVEKDRFLVVSVKIPSLNISPKDLGDLWKNSVTKTDEYRLKCSSEDVGKNLTKSKTKIHDTNSVEYKLNHLQHSHKKLIKNMDMVKMLQLFTLLLTFVGLIFGYYTYKNRIM